MEEERPWRLLSPHPTGRCSGSRGDREKLELTNNPYDLAIDGEGFFQIRLPDGRTGYTRDGRFQPNSNGQIVDSIGHYLEPAITLPQDTLSTNIGTDGTVTLITAGAPNVATQVGQITLARFNSPAGLQRETTDLSLTPEGLSWRTIYVESPASGSPLVGNPGINGTGKLCQGVRLAQSKKVRGISRPRPWLAQIIAVGVFLAGVVMIGPGVWSGMRRRGPMTTGMMRVLDRA